MRLWQQGSAVLQEYAPRRRGEMSRSRGLSDEPLGQSGPVSGRLSWQLHRTSRGHRRSWTPRPVGQYQNTAGACGLRLLSAGAGPSPRHLVGPRHPSCRTTVHALQTCVLVGVRNAKFHRWRHAIPPSEGAGCDGASSSLPVGPAAAGAPSILTRKRFAPWSVGKSAGAGSLELTSTDTEAPKPSGNTASSDVRPSAPANSGIGVASVIASALSSLTMGKSAMIPLTGAEVTC